MSLEKIICDITRYHLMSIMSYKFISGQYFILINFKWNICNLQLISVFLIV